jgi:hypothetical protein
LPASIAHIRPDAPAPMIMTSVSVMIFLQHIEIGAVKNSG